MIIVAILSIVLSTPSFRFCLHFFLMANHQIGQFGCRQTGTQTPHNASIRDCTMSMLFCFQRFMTIVELCILSPSFRTHPKLNLKIPVCGSFVCKPLNNLCIACANNDIATSQSLLVT